MVHWAFGFVEDDFEPDALLRHKFPCKVGGRPAWLNPVLLPLPNQLQCGKLKKTSIFLLQVYAAPQAGAPDDHPGAFHRSIFIFISPEGDTLHEPGAVRAFRCQLPRVNPYYSPDPSTERLPTALPTKLCSDHCTSDPWSTDATMAQADSALFSQAATPPLLKELEIVIDVDEEDSEDESLAVPSMQSRIDQYHARVNKEGDMSDAEAFEVDKMLGEQETADDRYWKKFQGVATSTPGCVLRYSRDVGAEPCWGRSSPLPGDIPPCPRCGASRIFEFQIMPQLLAFLGIDDMAVHAPDWLTMAVYTCSASCIPEEGTIGEQESPSYAEEFVFVQPPYSEP